jgi:carbon-monoxide dehydrogenase small subunit
MNKNVNFTLNGESANISIPAHWTLLRCLRDVLGLTGAKQGCESGHCGSCVVLLDGKPVNSCLVLSGEVEGHEVWTIEGLSQNKNMQLLQQKFLEYHALQCGICTPGVLVTSYGFLLDNPHPSRAEVRWALAGNLCRCTGYERIIEAVLAAGGETDG